MSIAANESRHCDGGHCTFVPCAAILLHLCFFVGCNTPTYTGGAVPSARAEYADAVFFSRDNYRTFMSVEIEDLRKPGVDQWWVVFPDGRRVQLPELVISDILNGAQDAGESRKSLKVDGGSFIGAEPYGWSFTFKDERVVDAYFGDAGSLKIAWGKTGKPLKFPLAQLSLIKLRGEPLRLRDSHGEIENRKLGKE